ncbi:transposase [Mesorhizobium sp. M1227]|uniref:transposase n=1 Tax=Mesorhizobium sp. M1227 TaxID=2957071 RepID=UPI00333AA826
MLWANRRLSWLNAILRGTFAGALVFFGTITVQAQRADGIFWVLRSGAPWRDLPERYGPRTTCYNSFDGGKQVCGTASCMASPKPMMQRCR